MSTTLEIWSPVVGWDGYYSVSSAGRVRSEERVVKVGEHSRHISGGIMKTPLNADGYPVANFSRDGVNHTFYVHDLVIDAFFGGKPEGLQARHLNDVKTDCSLGNLALGDARANQLDAVRNGRHFWASRTHCIHGHEFTPENTKRYPGRPGTRYCRRCQMDRQERRNASRKIGAAA